MIVHCVGWCHIMTPVFLQERVFKLQNQKLVERKKAAEDTRSKKEWPSMSPTPMIL